jgi:hypothetical protein
MQAIFKNIIATFHGDLIPLPRNYAEILMSLRKI